MNDRTPARRHAAWLVLSALLVSGCSASVSPVAYYSLLGTAPPPPADQRHEQLVVSIGPVVIPDVLKQSQIVTGGTEGRYQLSEGHRWTGDLDKEIGRAVAEQLSARLGTQRVVVFPWDQGLKATRRVVIDVLAMGGEPEKEAILAVRWGVVDPEGQQAAVVRRSDLREVPAAPGYPAWVVAQQRNIARLGEEIATELQASLKK